MPRLLVVNAAALSASFAVRSDLVPNLSDLIAEGSFAPLRPCFPALTIPVQATLTTGAPPSEHGMIANGLMERDACEVHFWHQPDSLLQRPRFWTALRRSRPALKVAMLFWQNSKHGDADVVITPHPLHTETGGTLSHCYSKPAGLSDRIEAEIGPFPLHHYWGPMAGLPSSRWIVQCTAKVMEECKPDLTLTYLPHLDYNTQRQGPKSKAVEEDLKAVDGLIGELRAIAAKNDARIVVLSEYGMSPVTRGLEINRAFRKAGWIGVRTIQGQEFLELGDCRAFAMVDHQVAHIYLRGLSHEEAAACVRELDAGIRLAATEEDKRSLGVAHERAGDLVAIAPREAWFHYPWWLDEAGMPSFARTVDIHRKPGYDPLDLFFDPVKKRIAQDPALVKGSHGRPPERDDEMGVLVAAADLPRGPVDAASVPGILARLLG